MTLVCYFVIGLAKAGKNATEVHSRDPQWTQSLKDILCILAGLAQADDKVVHLHHNKGMG